MKYIIFEFHLSGFNSAPGTATGNTAKENTGTSTFLRFFTPQKHSHFQKFTITQVFIPCIITHYFRA